MALPDYLELYKRAWPIIAAAWDDPFCEGEYDGCPDANNMPQECVWTFSGAVEFLVRAHGIDPRSVKATRIAEFEFKGDNMLHYFWAPEGCFALIEQKGDLDRDAKQFEHLLAKATKRFDSVTTANELKELSGSLSVEFDALSESVVYFVSYWTDCGRPWDDAMMIKAIEKSEALNMIRNCIAGDYRSYLRISNASPEYTESFIEAYGGKKDLSYTGYHYEREATPEDIRRTLADGCYPEARADAQI